jgi:hypothetical protein
MAEDVNAERIVGQILRGMSSCGYQQSDDEWDKE